MHPTSALQIAQSQFDYSYAQLTNVLQSIHLVPWLVLALAAGLVAILVNRIVRGSVMPVICPRDQAPARVELAVVFDGSPRIIDCSRWSRSGPCTGACRCQLQS